jgi:hypothetical protein
MKKRLSYIQEMLTFVSMTFECSSELVPIAIGTGSTLNIQS